MGVYLLKYLSLMVRMWRTRRRRRRRRMCREKWEVLMLIWGEEEGMKSWVRSWDVGGCRWGRRLGRRT